MLLPFFLNSEVATRDSKCLPRLQSSSSKFLPRWWHCLRSSRAHPKSRSTAKMIPIWLSFRMISYAHLYATEVSRRTSRMFRLFRRQEKNNNNLCNPIHYGNLDSIFKVQNPMLPFDKEQIKLVFEVIKNV